MRGNYRDIEPGAVRGTTKDRERESALREVKPLLTELYTVSQELFSAETKSDVAECLVDCIEEIFGRVCAGVFWFNSGEGKLRATALSDVCAERLAEPPVVEPGDTPIWNSYRSGETIAVEEPPAETSPEWFEQFSNALVVPVDDYGVILACNREGESVDEATVVLSELLAAGGKAALDRLSRDQTCESVTDRLSKRQDRVRELEEAVNTIEALQQRIAGIETRSALETVVCEEFAAIDRIACAWIGQPQAADTDLRPTATAGECRGYLDMAHTADDETIPAQRAASRREPVTVPNIAQQVQEDSWAKEALSCGFGSVMSVPLIYHDVLYGVLTVYSKQNNAFSDSYEKLLVNTASLVVNYIHVFDQRQFESSDVFIDLEFEVSEPACLLHTLATQTGTTLRFDAVTETTDTTTRVLVTVLDGEPKQVLDRAATLSNITDAAWFGKPDNRQLALTVRKTFLASKIRKHGGRLIDLVADGDTAQVRIEVPAGVAERPLLEALTNQFDSIDLVAKQQTLSSDRPENLPLEELLTDRQFEILNAAYYGGYYETPREVTGEELADAFDISSPVVYDHLQNSHRALLDSLLGNRDNSHE